MAFKLPPNPVGVPPGHSFWNDWYEKLRSIINGIGTLSWSVIDFTNSNLTDIQTRNHNDLQNIQGGGANSYYHLTQTQQTDLTDSGDSTLHYHAADRARANHTGTQTMSTISDLPVLSSGTYTPTFTNIANIDSSSANPFQYLRVGNVVNVSGYLTIDPTAISASTQLGISLPITSNFGNVYDCAGTGSARGFVETGAIFADAVNDRAEFRFVAVDSNNHTMSIVFTYRII